MNKNENGSHMKSKSVPNQTFLIFLAVLLGYITYQFVMNQLPDILSDYHGHVYVYLPMFSWDTLLEGWQIVPYFMWHSLVLFLNQLIHIPLEESAAFASCIFAIFSYFVTCWILQKIFLAIYGFENTRKVGILAFGLSILQGIYFDWINVSDAYLGIFSINPLHNSTQMCVRAFSLLCLVLVYDIWGKQNNKEYKGLFFKVERGLKKYYMILAILMFLSVLAKPTFAEMFIPAVGILMIGKLLWKVIKKEKTASKYFLQCVHMFLAFLPALLYILLQFIDYFIIDNGYYEEVNVIFTSCGEVWSIFSDNIVLSIALGMAFPLYVFLISPAWFFKTNLGKLGLGCYVIGMVEALFLAESANKFAHANFIWPMISGMTMMWIVSLIRLLMLEKEADNKKKMRFIYVAWFLFIIHVLCGYLYLNVLI